MKKIFSAEIGQSKDSASNAVRTRRGKSKSSPPEEVPLTVIDDTPPVQRKNRNESRFVLEAREKMRRKKSKSRKNRKQDNSYEDDRSLTSIAADDEMTFLSSWKVYYS